MQKTSFETPSLYGDHHVIEVRRLLLSLPGVQDVYASSAFHVVEVTYDPEKIREEDIRKVLDEAGYLNELPIPVETGQAAYERPTQSFFRHTEVFETSRHVVSFAQNISYSGRPLWNCPGFGVIKNKMED